MRTESIWKTHSTKSLVSSLFGDDQLMIVWMDEAMTASTVEAAGHHPFTMLEQWFKQEQVALEKVLDLLNKLNARKQVHPDAISEQEKMIEELEAWILTYGHWMVYICNKDSSSQLTDYWDSQITVQIKSTAMRQLLSTWQRIWPSMFTRKLHRSD